MKKLKIEIIYLKEYYISDHRIIQNNLLQTKVNILKTRTIILKLITLSFIWKYRYNFNLFWYWIKYKEFSVLSDSSSQNNAVRKKYKLIHLGIWCIKTMSILRSSRFGRNNLAVFLTRFEVHKIRPAGLPQMSHEKRGGGEQCK